MTVATTSNKVTYNGDGVTTVWGYTFPVALSTDLQIYITDSAGVITLLGSLTGYTVDLVNKQVTYPSSGSPLAAGSKITILRSVDLLQTVDWKRQGAFDSEVAEAAIDKLTEQAQQLTEALARSLKLPQSETGTDANTRLPAIAQRASKFLAFDASGNPIQADGVASVPVSSFATTILDDLNAAAVLTTLGITAYIQTLLAAANAGAAQTTLGISAFIKTLLDDADGPTALATLGALAKDGSIAMTGDLDMSGNDIRRVLTLNDTYLSGLRNRIINGGMQLDQRSAGAAKTINSASTSYTLDRWGASGDVADGVYTVQRLTATPPTGFTHYLRVAVTTADAAIAAGQTYKLVQYMEGNNVRDFLFGSASSKTITLSFWVRSSVTGTFSGSLINSAGNRSYPFSYTISSANTWEQKTVTVAGDTSGTWLTDTGVGIGINFDLGTGTTLRGAAGAWAASTFFGVTGAVSLIATNAATFDLTGIQVEVGTIASTFEHRSEAIELLLCQRYFEKSYLPETATGANSGSGLQEANTAQIGATSMRGGNIAFKATKRVAPTITLWNSDGTAAQWSWISTGGVSTKRATTAVGVGPKQFSLAQAVAAEFYAEGHWTADAEL